MTKRHIVDTVTATLLFRPVGAMDEQIARIETAALFLIVVIVVLAIVLLAGREKE